MKTLYFDCASGISGDMAVAALLDAGADEEALRRGLASLKVDGYSIRISRVVKSGIDACDFDVRLVQEEDAYHDGRHHHGEEAHEHHHGHHRHDVHGHTHTAQDHGHNHRNLGDINAIIEESGITPRAKELAKKIFRVVAQAEAVVHNKPLDQVHFHEVGAVDSIVDIVGAAICVDNLAPGRIVCSPLREGTGTIRCQHGIIPVPAPATLEIAKTASMPLIITDNQGEMVTPTGAAIAAALADHFGQPSCGKVTQVGYGAGKREYKTANVLRVVVMEAETGGAADEVLKLECNLDDMTGEELAFACERLLDAGALDAWCTPIYMKKNRPAQMLSVLLEPEAEMEQAIVDRIFRYTSTLGVRRSLCSRHVKTRRMKTVETRYGPVQVKESTWKNASSCKVEYESAYRLAEQNEVGVKEIMGAAYAEIENRK